MTGDEGAAVIADETIQELARVAALPLAPGHATALARALEVDLRLIRTVRRVAVGEIYPAGVAPLSAERADG